MTNNVDDQIVNMKFNNSTFEAAAKVTMGTLDALKKSLTFSDSKKGLEDLDNSAKKFSLNGVGSAVEGISAKFLALSTIGITALANITNRAVDAGIEMAKSFTIDPVKDGLKEYETQLDSVQTILANTQAEGAKLKDVNAALNELNTYSDKTIYNFTEMANNIGTFTAAGVNLKTSTASIKGIANLAALSGSNSQQASTAMYQLSQAIANNKVGLQDWNSVVNAGMGGRTFQAALFQTAKAMGTIKTEAPDFDVWTKGGNSFRDSLKDGWLTGKVLTSTLSTFTGDMTDAQLKQMGFRDDQIKAIQKQAKTASDAATKVKTFTQLIDTLKEATGSGWAQTWQIIFGNFGEAKKLWTGVSNSLGGIVNASSTARNKLLTDWKSMGGRDMAIDAISNGFSALMSIFRAVGKAWRNVFPPASGNTLLVITKGFSDLVAKLTPGAFTLLRIQRIFRGVFSIFDIGWQLLKGVIGVFGDLFGTIGNGSGSFLEFLAHLAYYPYLLDQAIKKGDGLSNFFKGLGDILSIPIQIFQTLIGLLVDFVTNSDAVSAPADAMGKSLGRLATIGDLIMKGLGGVGKLLTGIGNLLAPFFGLIESAFANFGQALANSMSTGDFEPVLDIINTGLLGGILLLVKKFFSNASFGIDVGGGFFGNISEALEGVTGTMKAMQAQIKANTLLKIAGALGLLTVSVVALSMIDPAKLTKALTAMSVGFGQLLASMAILDKIGISSGFLKTPMIAASMVLLAGSIDILVIAIAALSQLSWSDLAKGLVGTAAAMAILVGAVALMPQKKMLLTSLGLVAVSVALNLMAGAIAIIGHMSWDTIVKGLAGIAGSMIILAVGMNAMQGALPGAAAMLIVAPALLALSATMKVLGTLSWVEIAKGLVALGGALVLLSVGMTAMMASLPGAAALLIAAPGLLAISGVMKAMGSLKWSEIGKGLVAMGGALAILAVGLSSMLVALPGALALDVAAVGLLALSVVLKTLGSMSWGSIIKGLVTLAAALAIIGVAGLLLAPVVLPLIGLGAAITLFGAGLALAGAGILAFATAFSLFASVGLAGVTVLTSIFMSVIKLIPMAAKALAQGIIDFAGTIATGGVAIAKAFATIIVAAADAVIESMPKIAAALNEFVQTAVDVVVTNTPKIANAGLKMITSLLKAVRDHVGDIVAIAVQIIVKFVGAIADGAPKLADAAAKAIIKFIKALSKAIDDNSNDLGKAGGDLAVSIGKGLVSGISGLVGEVYNALKSMVNSAVGKLGGLGKKALGKLGFGGGGDDDSDSGSGRVVTPRVSVGTGSASSSALDDSSSSLTATAQILSRKISDDLVFTPTITPVIDLTNVQTSANQISAMLSTTPVTPVVSYAQAADISSDQEDLVAAIEEYLASNTGTTNTFNQTITSPEPVSAIEVYRGTKSLLSMAKEALS